MRIIYRLLVTVLFTSILTLSCVNQDYDLNNLKDVNTDISFGGEYFGLPIGKLSEVTLGDFIKPGDMLSVVDGKYEFRYSASYDTEIGTIDPIELSLDVPAFGDMALDLTDVSISNIDMPTVMLSGLGTTNIPDAKPSVVIPPLTIPISGEAPINILYGYTNEIKQINHINLGQEGVANGELITLRVSPSYSGVLSTAKITIDSFVITFPVGFELGLINNDTYGGRLSNNNRTYTITGKALNTVNPIKFHIKKLTLNPAEDQENGELIYKHKLTYDASFTINGTTASDISGDEISVALNIDQKLNMASSDFDINTIQTEVQPEKINISIDQALGSDFIQSLSNVSLKTPTALTIHIAAKGLPQQISGMLLKNYKITFPEFMEFSDQELNKTKVLSINESINRNSGLTKIVYVSGFKFAENPIQPNGNIQLSGIITASGDAIEIPATNNIQSADIENIVISPTVSIGQMQVGTAKGDIKPAIDMEPQIVDFDFDDAMSYLFDSNLDLDRVALKLSVQNTTDITSKIGIELTPYDASGIPISENIVSQLTGIDIQPESTSNLWLSNSTEGMPMGYTFVENQHINRLFSRMPSKMKADISVSLQNKNVSIDLSSPDAMKMNIDYEVVAPLAPGEDFKLVYEERIEGLKQQLTSITDYISSLAIELNASNEIPLDLKISAQPFDSNGSNIGVSVVVDGIIQAGGKDGVPTDSSIKLSLTETTPGDLAKLDQIKLTLIGSCNKEYAGTNLEESQKLNLSGKVFIPGGLNITDKDE